MRILSIDPGLRHQVWSITHWPDNVTKTTTPIVHAKGWMLTCLSPARALGAAEMTVKGFLTEGHVNTLIDHRDSFDHVIIEGQNLLDAKVRKNDVRDLTWVAASISTACRIYLPDKEHHIAPTESSGTSNQWSRFRKKVRHDYYTDKLWPEIAKEFAKFRKRQQGDFLDTVGMSFWLALGKPRAGV